MSWQPVDEPDCPEVATEPAVETIIVPRARDIGGFEVRRALPSSKRQMVGPFIFFDQMGPGEFLVGQGIDVRPHPHIGLATLTYLFRGRIMHRDSLGSALPIEPGAVNLMTAGRGIVHSERTAEEDRQKAGELYGIQSWIALPRSVEEREPDFRHHAVGELPVVEDRGAKLRLIAGTGFGHEAPTQRFSEMIYADAALDAGAKLPFDAEHEERGIYIVSGSIEIAGDVFEAGRLLVFRPGDAVGITAREPSRIMLVGGESMDGPRHIWWNFVSSSKDRIRAAKADWKAGRFDPVPDDEEFIPLPER